MCQQYVRHFDSIEAVPTHQEREVKRTMKDALHRVRTPNELIADKLILVQNCLKSLRYMIIMVSELVCWPRIRGDVAAFDE